MIQRPSLRRALVISVVLHTVAAVVAVRLIVPTHARDAELVDIELAPPPPKPEALPAEVARPAQALADQAPAPDPESSPPNQPGEGPGEVPIDAGVDATPDARPDAPIDAPIDARPDAPIDARPDARPDAPIDARPDAPIDARPDAGALEDAGADASADALTVAAVDDAASDTSDAAQLAIHAAGDDTATLIAAGDAGDDAASIASGTGSGSAGSGSLASAGSGSGSVASPGSGSGSVASPGAGSGSGSDSVASPGSGPGSLASAGSSSGSGVLGASGSRAQAGSADGSASTTASGSAAGAAAMAGAASGSSAATAGGSGAVAPLDTAALAAALGAAANEPTAPGSAVAGATNEPAVEGAPTTAGTAANLLTYFPDHDVVTALIRFDRLRGTEWAAQTERLLRPLPDYQALFGPRDAGIADKLETLVISTPRPHDATATTLVARTTLARGPLRDFLGAVTPVTWSSSRGGLLGKRPSASFPGDRRVILSPFKGWFLLAQPADLGALATATKGNPDTVEATGKLPPWIAGIRKIERETGEPRGPALVVTLALGGKRLSLAGRDLGLGIQSLPTPDRVSLAAELVPQGWLVRGNLRFASDADASELIAAVQRVQQRVADSYAIRLVIGKPIARVIANLAFARNGPRVSYATSMSIADARAILAVAAQQLDQQFGRAP